MGVLLAFLMVIGLSVSPKQADASLLSSLFGSNNNKQITDAPKETSQKNSQNMYVLQATTSPDRDVAKGGGDITIENSALLPEIGPLGTAADVKTQYLSDQIVNYVVKKGDTLAGVAKMFGVSSNTIIWSNDLKKGQALTEGDTLVILPVSGLEYTILKGDTLKKIARKFKADIDEIGKFNGITEESVLAAGDTIIIPDGEMASDAPSSTSGSKSTTGSSKSSEPYLGGSGPAYDGYYIKPVADGILTQGRHGHNGVDIGRVPVGTPVMAAANGVVIISRDSGWNGGYGEYIVISHNNGTQTLYGHLSATNVSAGDQVTQGQVIGALGNTGKSTGKHLHFEVRGGKNPGVDDSWASR